MLLLLLKAYQVNYTHPNMHSYDHYYQYANNKWSYVTECWMITYWISIDVLNPLFTCGLILHILYQYMSFVCYVILHVTLSNEPIDQYQLITGLIMWYSISKYTAMALSTPITHIAIKITILENDYTSIYKLLEHVRPHWKRDNIQIKVIYNNIIYIYLFCNISMSDIMRVCSNVNLAYNC